MRNREKGKARETERERMQGRGRKKEREEGEEDETEKNATRVRRSERVRGRIVFMCARIGVAGKGKKALTCCSSTERRRSPAVAKMYT